LLPPTLLAQHGNPPKPNFAMQIQAQARLKDNSPAPPGTLLELDLQDGEMVEQCQTDSTGRCRFSPPSHGIYVVRAKAAGYKEASQLVDLQNAQTGMANLVLTPIPGEAPLEPPPGAGDHLVSAADLGVPANAWQEYQKGQQALAKKDVDGGISHLQKAIKLYAAFPQAYTLLGNAYLQQQNFRSAQTALEKAVQLDPKSGDAYLGLGAVFNQTKNYPEAEKALTRGLELNPDAILGEYELAKAYWAMGRWQDAEPHAEKAVNALPNLAGAHVLMGDILLRKKNPAGALHEFQEYLRLDPKGPMASSVQDMIAKIQKALQGG
jgi:Flp pilus assembly protein TadD